MLAQSPDGALYIRRAVYFRGATIERIWKYYRTGIKELEMSKNDEMLPNGDIMAESINKSEDGKWEL